MGSGSNLGKSSVPDARDGSVAGKCVLDSPSRLEVE
jgi:hypothetical protein